MTDPTCHCVAIKKTALSPSPNAANKLFGEEPLLQLQYLSADYFDFGPYAITPSAFLNSDTQGVEFLPIEPILQQRASAKTSVIDAQTQIISYSNQWQPPANLSCQTHHSIELLIRYALRGEAGTGVWAERIGTKINIVVRQAGRTTLVNTFDIETTTDAAYYVLACFQQLSLAHETTPLYLTGEALSELKIFLGKYIRHIATIAPCGWDEAFGDTNKDNFALLSWAAALYK